jgi:hypothetical protein
MNQSSSKRGSELDDSQESTKDSSIENTTSLTPTLTDQGTQSNEETHIKAIVPWLTNLPRSILPSLS